MLLASAISCRRDQIVEEPPRLRSITVTESLVSLPESGPASFTFQVEDPDYVFDYDHFEGYPEVELQMLDGSKPALFSLMAVQKGNTPGTYMGIISDLGESDGYTCAVVLVIKQYYGDDGLFTSVSSAPFTVQMISEKPSDPVLSTGLPVVYVDTEGGKSVSSKTVDVNATLSILGAAQYPGLSPQPCRIRGRGNTTWTWPKKPYLIKFDERTSVLGMPKHKRWVLLANFLDRTLMRNLVSMYVASLTSLEWSPSCVPVELVLNGKHRGSYLLIEQVRVDKNRLAITEMTPKDNEGDAVTGGYLLELDFHYDNPVQWADHLIPFAVKYPDSEELTEPQLNYIKDYISKTTKALYSEDYQDPEKGYAAYIDIDSFIDYWIVFEVMCNHELGNPGSVFFHKDRLGKLKAGPVWDFDWGVLSFYTSAGEYDLVNGQSIWYARMLKDPAFRDRLRARFQELRPALETVPAYMDAAEALLEKSADLNFQMWNPADDKSQNGGRIINGDENMTFHAAVQRLKNNYNKHLQVIDQKL